MTTKDFHPISNQFQILFWDFVINFMGAARDSKVKFTRLFPKKVQPKRTGKKSYAIFTWIAVGLYIGLILGYLGI